METLNDYKDFFTGKGIEIEREVKILLNRLSQNKVPDMLQVLNRIGEPDLSETEIKILDDLCWLGFGFLGITACSGLLQELEEKENKSK